MKKAIFILTLLCSVYGFSQNGLYGIRAGVNVSNLDFDDVTGISDNSHRNGFAIGGFAEYELKGSLSIAPELQFSAEGAKNENLRIDYIQMPILFKYAVANNISVALGPLAGLKVHEFEDGFANLAFSGVGGIEYMITDEIFLDFRYTYGLTNVFDKDLGVEAKNSNMQFGVGVKL